MSLAVELLLRKARAVTLRGAVRAASLRLRTDAGCATSGPLDEASLQSILISRDLTVESGLLNRGTLGHTYATRNGLRAVIHSDVSQSEFRFTIAHELAHTLFFDIRRRPAARLIRHAPDEEELCDTIASALLVPDDDLVSSDSARCGQDPQVLQEIEHSHGIPSWRLAIRLVEVPGLDWQAAVRWQIESPVRARIKMWKCRDGARFVATRKRAERDGVNGHVFKVALSQQWKALREQVVLARGDDAVRVICGRNRFKTGEVREVVTVYGP